MNCGEEATALSDVLNGTLHVSFLDAVIYALDDDNALRWNCLMTRAIMNNNPIEVFQLGGSFNFEDPLDNEIACILLQCAGEMMKTIDTDTEQENEKSGPKEKKKRNKRRSKNGRDARFNLSHNARQAASRYLKNNKTIPRSVITRYAIHYNENEESLLNFCKHIMSWQNSEKSKKRSEVEES